MITIKPIPAFTDNYIWCITNNDDKTAVVVDPGDAETVLAHLEQWDLTCLLYTSDAADE